MASVRAAFAFAALAAAALAGLADADQWGTPEHWNTGVTYHHGQANFEVDFDHPGTRDAQGMQIAPGMQELVAEFQRILSEDPDPALAFQDRKVFNHVAERTGPLLLDDITCVYCDNHLTFKSVRILSCLHVVHEQCYRCFPGRTNFQRKCPLCRSTGPHTPLSSNEIMATVLGRTLLALQAQGLASDELDSLPPEHDDYIIIPEPAQASPQMPTVDVTTDEEEEEAIEAPPHGSQEFSRHIFLQEYLQTTFQLGQKVIDATIKIMLEVSPWTEEMQGIMGETADRRLQTLNDIREMAELVYRTVYPSGTAPTPVELTSHPLNRERAIQSLMSILVTVSDTPIGAAVSAVGDAANLLHPGEARKWIRACRRISVLVSHVIEECPLSRVVYDASLEFDSFVSAGRGYIQAVYSNAPSEFMDGWINTMIHYRSRLAGIMFLFPDAPDLVRLWQTNPREYLIKDVGGAVQSLFVGAAALFYHAADDVTAAIFSGSVEERRMVLMALQELVTIAVTSPEIETLEPAPEVPGDANDEATSVFLRNVQVSLHRSLVAWLPTSMPISFPPLYPGRRDILLPVFAMHVMDRLAKVQNVVDFFADRVDTSDYARLIRDRFDLARQEAVFNLQFYAFSVNYAVPFGIPTDYLDSFLRCTNERVYDFIPPELHF